MFSTALDQLVAGESLSATVMEQAVTAMMQGDVPFHDMARFLTLLHEQGETVDELTGAARAMRAQMTPIRHRRSLVIDTCGPGGHGSGTFNISTAAAIVTAAAGVPVAKHGNRSITSKTGSADALSALGVNILAPVEVVERCLNELGLCFCFAPSLHPAMKHVGAVRKSLPFRTIFNLLGPLCNPAGAAYQLLGVGKSEMLELLAGALAQLGTTRSLVAWGEDGIGELSLAAPTTVVEVTPAGLQRFTWTAADFGLAAADRSSFLVDTPEESATLIRSVLAGAPGPARDIVVLNAAAALWTVGVSPSPKTCAQLAQNAIDSGTAGELLERLIAVSQDLRLEA
jgi:anthranilate phosphoribosyltransferase